MSSSRRSILSIACIAILSGTQVLQALAQRSSSTFASSSRSVAANPFSVRPASSSATPSASVCRCPSSPLSSAAVVSASRCPSASISTTTSVSTSVTTTTVTVTATTTDSTSCARGRELVTNGGFESGLNGYTTSTTGSGASVSASCGQGTNFAYTGNCGALFNIAAGSASGTSGILQQVVNNFCANFKYTVAFNYKITTGCTLELQVVEATTGVVQSTGSPSQWVRFAVVLQTNANPGSNFISYPFKFIARSVDSSRSCGISIDNFSITADQPA